MRSPLPFILIILGAAVGLLLTAQWKTPPTRSVNPIGPFLALKSTDEDLTKEQTNLKKEIADLQQMIDKAAQASTSDASSKTLVSQMQQLKEQAGLTQVTGSGLTITLDDAQSGIGNPDNISHAADLRDTVNLLWLKGATAISINGERVVATTSIDCLVNTILINNTKMTAPFTIVAVGDSNQLAGAVNDQSNLSDIWKRVKGAGLVFNVKTSWRVSVPAYTGSYPLSFAKSGS